MSEILEESNRLNIPVFMSAVGVEPYVDSKKGQRLKAALNLPCLKGISVRDDIGSLTADWLDSGSECKVYKAIDPAIYCPFTYNIPPRKREKTEHPLVGLGMIRHAIFSDYGHPEIDKAFLLNFWEQVVYLLEKKGYRWAIFTNGAIPDERAAYEIRDYIGHGEIISVPIENADLIKNINQFDCVIGGRMHSNIISYSLGIPCVGFVWNQKLRFWGQKIGHPERLLEIEDMTPENAVNALVKAYEEGIEPISEEKFQCVYEPVKIFADTWVKPREKQSLSGLPIEEKCVALGLGSINSKNALSNSKIAFQHSLENGHKVFELNLRFTSDEKLVCTAGWNRGNVKNLGVSIGKNAKNLVLHSDDFKLHKSHMRFPTMTFDDFIQLLKDEAAEPVTIIIETGDLSVEVFKELTRQVSKKIAAEGLTSHRFFIFVRNAEEIKCIQENGSFEMIFKHQPKSNARKLVKNIKLNSDFNLCKKNGIKIWAADSIKSYVRRKPLIKANEMTAYITSATTTNELLELISDKTISFVGTTDYTVNYLNQLIH